MTNICVLRCEQNHRTISESIDFKVNYSVLSKNGERTQIHGFSDALLRAVDAALAHFFILRMKFEMKKTKTSKRHRDEEQI